MAKVTAQEWLQNWGNGLNGAGAKIKKGVQSVTVAPGVAAAAKEDKLRAGFNAALDSGKWSNNVQRVSLGQWQDAMANKGVANISSGVAQAQKTRQQQIAQMLQDNDAAVAAVANMPTDTQEQRIAKATAFMRARAAATKGR